MSTTDVCSYNESPPMPAAIGKAGVATRRRAAPCAPPRAHGRWGPSDGRPVGQTPQRRRAAPTRGRARQAGPDDRIVPSLDELADRTARRQPSRAGRGNQERPTPSSHKLHDRQQGRGAPQRGDDHVHTRRDLPQARRTLERRTPRQQRPSPTTQARRSRQTRDAPAHGPPVALNHRTEPCHALRPHQLNLRTLGHSGRHKRRPAARHRRRRCETRPVAPRPWRQRCSSRNLRAPGDEHEAGRSRCCGHVSSTESAGGSGRSGGGRGLRG